MGSLIVGLMSGRWPVSWKFSPFDMGIFSTRNPHIFVYRVSCLFTRCCLQNGCFAASAFSRRTIFSSGGGGGVISLITPGFCRRGLAVNVASGIIFGQLVRDSTLIRRYFEKLILALSWYCVRMYSKRIPRLDRHPDNRGYPPVDWSYNIPLTKKSRKL